MYSSNCIIGDSTEMEDSQADIFKNLSKKLFSQNPAYLNRQYSLLKVSDSKTLPQTFPASSHISNYSDYYNNDASKQLHIHNIYNKGNSYSQSVASPPFEQCQATHNIDNYMSEETFDDLPPINDTSTFVRHRKTQMSLRKAFGICDEIPETNTPISKNEQLQILGVDKPISTSNKILIDQNKILNKEHNLSPHTNFLDFNNIQTSAKENELTTKRFFPTNIFDRKFVKETIFDSINEDEIYSQQLRNQFTKLKQTSSFSKKLLTPSINCDNNITNRNTNISPLEQQNTNLNSNLNILGNSNEPFIQHQLSHQNISNFESIIKQKSPDLPSHNKINLIMHPFETNQSNEDISKLQNLDNIHSAHHHLYNENKLKDDIKINKYTNNFSDYIQDDINRTTIFQKNIQNLSKSLGNDSLKSSLSPKNQQIDFETGTDLSSLAQSYYLNTYSNKILVNQKDSYNNINLNDSDMYTMNSLENINTSHINNPNTQQHRWSLSIDNNNMSQLFGNDSEPKNENNYKRHSYTNTLDKQINNMQHRYPDNKDILVNNTCYTSEHFKMNIISPTNSIKTKLSEENLHNISNIKSHINIYSKKNSMSEEKYLQNNLYQFPDNYLKKPEILEEHNLNNGQRYKMEFNLKENNKYKHENNKTNNQQIQLNKSQFKPVEFVNNANFNQLKNSLHNELLSKVKPINNCSNFNSSSILKSVVNYQKDLYNSEVLLNSQIESDNIFSNKNLSPEKFNENSHNTETFNICKENLINENEQLASSNLLFNKKVSCDEMQILNHGQLLNDKPPRQIRKKNYNKIKIISNSEIPDIANKNDLYQKPKLVSSNNNSIFNVDYSQSVCENPQTNSEILQNNFYTNLEDDIKIKNKTSINYANIKPIKQINLNEVTDIKFCCNDKSHDINTSNEQENKVLFIDNDFYYTHLYACWRQVIEHEKLMNCLLPMLQCSDKDLELLVILSKTKTRMNTYKLLSQYFKFFQISTLKEERYIQHFNTNKDEIKIALEKLIADRLIALKCYKDNVLIEESNLSNFIIEFEKVISTDLKNLSRFHLRKNELDKSVALILKLACMASRNLASNVQPNHNFTDLEKENESRRLQEISSKIYDAYLLTIENAERVKSLILQAREYFNSNDNRFTPSNLNSFVDLTIAVPIIKHQIFEEINLLQDELTTLRSTMNSNSVESPC